MEEKMTVLDQEELEARAAFAAFDDDDGADADDQGADAPGGEGAGGKPAESVRELEKEVRKMGRTRNWRFVTYEEDNFDVEGFFDWAVENGVKVAMSPVHTPENEKPHRHWVVVFGGVKSYEQVLGDVQEFRRKDGTVKIVKRVASLVGALRYLIHLDSPKKQQFKVEDVRCTESLDFKKMIKTDEDKAEEKKDEFFSWFKQINAAGCESLNDVTQYCLDGKNFEMLKWVIKSAYFLEHYLKGVRTQNARRYCDVEDFKRKSEIGG